MLYDDITCEFILARMVGRVEDWARGRGMTIDTREGSLIRTALAPAAAEMKLLYIELDEILDETFADTASRKFLIRRCAERGIAPYAATNAVRNRVMVNPYPAQVLSPITTYSTTLGSESQPTARKPIDLSIKLIRP